MKRVVPATAIVIAIAAGAALVVGRGGHGESAAALRRHYYDVGRRACRQAIPPAPSGDGSQSATSGVLFGVGISTRGVPKRYRAALIAGCQSVE